MPSQEPFPQNDHEVASEHILGALQSLLDSGKIPGGGMVSSYITVAETMNKDGVSKVQVLWSDNRTHLLMGLLAYGQTMVTMGMGGPPEH